MKQNTSKNNEKKVLSREDVMMYRLLVLLVLGIIGVTVFSNIGKLNTMFYSIAFQIICGLLLAASIIVPVYIKLVAGTDESKRVFPIKGICVMLIPVFVMALLYTQLDGAVGKFQTVFIVDVLLAIVYNLNLKNAMGFSALAAAYALMTAVIKTNAYSAAEKVILFICEVGIFAVPAIVTAISVYSLCSGEKYFKLRGKKLFSLPSGTYAVLLIIFSAVAVAAGLLTILLPQVFIYVLCSLLGIYLVLGIICTIKTM